MVVLEDRRSPLAAIDLWVGAGSAREQPEERGAAHFLEHMVFKGTPERGPGALDSAFEDTGAVLSAATTRDGIHFHSTVPARYAAELIAVLCDAVARPALDPAETERERRVILDELARQGSDWRRATLDALFASAWSGHPYASPVAGTARDVLALRREALAAFHGREFRAERAVLVVAGALPSEEVRAAAERAFEAWPARQSPGDSARSAASGVRTVPAAGGGGVATPAGTVGLGFAVRQADAQTRATAEVAAALLGDARGGRLPRLLRGLADPEQTAVEWSPLREGGLYSLAVRVAPARSGEALKRLESAVAGLAAAPPSPAEVDYARRRVLGSWLFETETLGGVAKRLGEAAISGRLEDELTFRRAIERVTPEDVQAFARERLRPDSAVRTGAGGDS